MRRIFVVSPLRGTPAQFDVIERSVATAVESWKRDSNPDPIMIEDFEVSLRGKLRADLFRSNMSRAEYLCLSIALMGHAPFAPHVFSPQFLDDNEPEQRAAGIAGGLAWLSVCDQVWVYRRHGISSGMEKEIHAAKSLGKPILVPAGWGP